MQHDPDSMAPQPAEQLSFTLDFPITARDMAMFRSGCAGAAMGYSFRMDAGGELCIDRGQRCVCRLRIHPETNRHHAYCQAPDSFGVPGNASESMPTRETLMELLTRWTGHEERLKAVDLHCHVIPGIDDGAQSLDMALRMLQMEAGQGVQHVVCTSHSFGMRCGPYRQQLQLLQKALVMQQPGFSLYPGCEIHCPSESPESVLQQVQRGEYALLGNSGHMLLEFDPDSSSRFMLDYVRRMLDLAAAADIRAKHVVIAHAERYRRLADNAEALNTLLAWGCRIQINAYSLAEEPKQSTKAFARRLLDERKVSFLGSDAHRTDHRPPCMKNGIRYVYDHCDVGYANAICFGNAMRLLAGALD